MQRILREAEADETTLTEVPAPDVLLTVTQS